jgi:hypothetical protein
MFMVRFAVVADNLQPPKHFAHGEKAQDFSENDSSSGKLPAIDVADVAQHSVGVDGASHGAGARDDGSRIAKDVGDRLEVGLELSQGTEAWSVRKVLHVAE